MKLYEINAAIYELVEQIQFDPDTGELLGNSEELFEQINNLQMERKSILDYLAKVVLNLRADQESLKGEEERLKARRKRLEAKEDRLLSILDRECKGEKTDCGVATFSYRNNTKVEVTDSDSAIGKPRRFCSDACRREWWKNHPEMVNRTAISKQKCAYCGEEFEYYGKKKIRTYCSRKCYAKAREKVYEEQRAKLEQQRFSCGTALQDLPADCLCASCKWFVDEKRSCPCKDKTPKKV